MSVDVPRLTRAALAAADGAPVSVPPPRIVHLGVGAFHRAHQAWYTAHAEDAQDWGISAFTGRSPAVADALTAQGGIYTLIERRADGDRIEHVGSIVSVRNGAADAISAAIANSGTALVTTTVTEGGYGLTARAEPNLEDPALAADLDALHAGTALGALAARSTAIRLLAGLDARRRAQGGQITIVPCDNVPENGSWLRRGLSTLADEIAPELGSWLTGNVSFISTSVDRITPRVGDDIVGEVAEATGWLDLAPVVTEPFSDWVLSGEFVRGAPNWASAGATMVSDIAAYESRKLWMLNGAHTLLAALGVLRGHGTVAASIADPVCRAAVDGFWAEATPNLPSSMATAGYADALLARFGNARMEHRLAQISTDAVGKIRVRIVPIARRQLAAGRSIAATAHAVAAWIECVRRGLAGHDVEGAAIERARGDSQPDRALLQLIDADLARAEAFRTQVLDALTAMRVGPESATSSPA